MTEPVEVDFFYGLGGITARDSRTHLKHGELNNVLTMQEVEMLSNAGWNTSEHINAAEYIILTGMYCRIHNVTRYNPQGARS
jgi:hypothetical protein